MRDPFPLWYGLVYGPFWPLTGMILLGILMTLGTYMIVTLRRNDEQLRNLK